MAESEHKAPPRAVPSNDAGYLEKITQAAFQSGISWKVIYSKWPGFQAAFLGFDIERVAAFDQRDVERLTEDTRIVRNGRKIQATIENARTCQRLIAEHGSFYGWLRSLDGLDYKSRSQLLCQTFKFMGPSGAYFFFWSVGEDVPPYEEWQAERSGRS
ncbi:MAG: DNA-3-methyladenine glycosylase I [Chloroflexota bacterium]